MKNNISLFASILLIILSITLNTSCVDQDFDAPPLTGFEDVEVNMTIAELKALHVLGEFTQIEEDKTIEGVIVADDASGNYYRTIIIQDATGGLAININLNELYNEYPIGRRIYVKVRGLYLNDYGNIIEMGGGTYESNGELRLAGIEEVLLAEHIIKGARDQELAPKDITIGELTDADYNTLVRITDVQFIESETNVSYADAVGLQSVNRNIEDCNGNSIIVRSSGYADFASELTPGGNGSIVAIFSVFFDDKQLFMRNVNDVSMAGERCGSGGVIGELMSIADLRAIYQGTTTVGPEGKKIKGVVISDLANGNWHFQNVVIQEEGGGAGILIRFADDNPYELGDIIEVNVSNVELSEFNGLLQMNNTPLANAGRVGTGSITPATMTVADILADFESIESTLVRIVDVELTKDGGTTYEFGTNVFDGSGTMTMFTSSFATFASATFPTDSLTLTAVVSQGGNESEQQLVMRNTNDVVVTGGGGPPVGGGDVNATFDGGASNTDIDLPGWINAAVQGVRKWQYKEFDGDVYAQATAYNDTEPNMEAWLITPSIDLSTPKTLNFDNAQAFWNHDGLSVYISTDFDGTDVNGATWQPLSPTLADSSTPDHDWIASGPVDLSGFSGTGYIGFKYVGNGPSTSETTSYRLDNIVVE